MNNPMNTFMKFNYVDLEKPVPASFESRTEELHLPLRLDSERRLIVPDTLHLRLIEPAQVDRTKEELENLLKRIDERVKEGKVVTVDRIKYIPKIQIREKIKIVPEVRYVYMPLGYEVTDQDSVVQEKPSQSDQNLKRLISNILGSHSPDLQNFHKLSDKEVEEFSSKAIDRITKPRLQMLEGSFKKSILQSRSSFIEKAEDETEMGSIRSSFVQSGDGNIITYLNQIRALQAGRQHQRKQYNQQIQLLTQKLRIITAQLNECNLKLADLEKANCKLDSEIISIKRQNKQLQNIKARLQSEVQSKEQEQLQDSDDFSLKELQKNLMDLRRILREKDEEIYHLRYFEDKGGVPEKFNLEGHLDQIKELRDQMLRLYRNNDYLAQQIELKDQKIKLLRSKKLQGDDRSLSSYSDSEHSTTPDYQNILQQNQMLRQRNADLTSQIQQLQDSKQLNDEIQRLRIQLAEQTGKNQILQIELINRNKILQTLKFNSIYAPLLLEALYRDQSDLALRYVQNDRLNALVNQLPQNDREFILQVINKTRIRCMLDLDQITAQARQAKAQLRKLKNAIIEYSTPEQLDLFKDILNANVLVEGEGYFKKVIDVQQIEKLGKEGRLIYMPDHMSKLKLLEIQHDMQQLLKADRLNSQELQIYKKSCVELINSRIDIFSGCQQCISKSQDLRRSQEWRKSQDQRKAKLTPLLFKAQNILRQEGKSDTERHMKMLQHKLKQVQSKVEPEHQQIFYEPQSQPVVEEFKESQRDDTSSRHSKLQEKKTKGRNSHKKYSKLVQRKQRSMDEESMK